MDSDAARQNREHRKLYLANRKSRQISDKPQQKSSSSIKPSNVSHTPESQLRYTKRSTSTLNHQSIIYDNSNANSSHFIGIHTSLTQTPTTNLNVTTPLSNISNAQPRSTERSTSTLNHQSIIYNNSNANPSQFIGIHTSLTQTPTTNLNVRTPLSNISNVYNTANSSANASDKRRLRRLILDKNKSKRTDNDSDTTSSAVNLLNTFNQNTDDDVEPHSTNSVPANDLLHDKENLNPSNSFAKQSTTLGVNSSNITPSTQISSILTNNTNMTSNNASEMRKRRKQILQNKRTNNITNSSGDTANNNSATSTLFNNTNLHSTNRRTKQTTPSSNISIGIFNISASSQKMLRNKRKYSLFCNGMASGASSLSNLATAFDNIAVEANNLQTNSQQMSTLPSFDFTPSDVPDNQEIHVDIFNGISKDYLDHGDQIIICQMCNAKLWRDESLRGTKTSKKNSFSLCCNYGKVQLPDLKEAPSSYKALFQYGDLKSKNFINNIRLYNAMFSFTSMGGKIDSSINKGKGPYIFRLGGQNYHSLGNLIPKDGSRPKFSQLYIYVTENKVSNRQSAFRGGKEGSTSNSNGIEADLIESLKSMLDSINVLVNSYRMARDCFNTNPNIDLKLRLIAKRQQDGRTYNLPTASEVAALIVGDIADSLENRDIIVRSRDGPLLHISELHPSYLPLQYPLLFPFGDDGYRVDILHRVVRPGKQSKRRTCTMREFFAYRIQDRVDKFSLILNSRRLFQQFLVDAYTMIESERLCFIKLQQKVLRCESFENLRTHKDQGNTSASNVGQRVILPSSFTGGARYMTQNYLDAMAICKWFGYPDFFITVTCNPKWPEIKRFLRDTTIRPEDRPDILCRLFKIKLDSLIKDLKDNAIFGFVQAVVYTIEFQKRGLPHSHICLFMHSDFKMPTVDHIDPVISAEIPNKQADPELFSLVSEFMIHGPCGLENMNCPCMIDNQCSKNFPKNYSEHTSIDENGFPQYRRRKDGNFVEKSGVKLDNRSVVPYNKYLLKRYQAHINVEWCNQGSSIKYLFKYINKGPDRAALAVERENNPDQEDDAVDEIRQYYDCRYISACEASWRIFGYDVHYRTPSVVRLPFHLPGQQTVVYDANDDLDDVLDKPSIASSMFMSWMHCNAIYPQAQNLTYVEFPTKFVWKDDQRTWKVREKGFSIGRIHSVSPSQGEAYFLRILLNKVKAPRSFEDICTINAIVHPTFRDACYALGLLDDDTEYIDAIEEASHSGSGYYLRSLFAMMLMSNSLSRPEIVWESTWTYLADDILYNQRRILRSPELSLSEDHLKNLTLFEIEKVLLRNNSSLKNFSNMPYPDPDSVASSNNRLITEELSYNTPDLKNEFDQLLAALTDEQHSIYTEITTAVQRKNGGVFFVYGYGGTGKTYLWKTLSASFRSKGQIVLNVASSGIASLLLTGGRTAHSRFRIPLNINEDSLCYVKPDSDIANLLKKTSLIIWDEAPMIKKHAFEALDRTLKDILGCDNSSYSDIPFGGKVIVFGGDFRQILPVVPNGSRHDIVNASLSSSYIWGHCKVLTLTKNMRLFIGSGNCDIEETRTFAKWLLDICEGKIGGFNDGEATIEIPDDLLITDSDDPISSLIDFVYPSILQDFTDLNFFQERAILAPKHDDVQEINDRLLSLFPGDEKEYFSSDKLCQSEHVNDEIDERAYSPDVLNGIKASGLPNHRLVLKVGVPVMLLRNVDQKNGLCNGTRLQVIALGNRVIEAKVISGSNIGKRTFIPRMTLTPSDNRIAFKFQRRQFPLAVCFAMTINKSQGQSLSRVGLYLKQPVFTHGQLYVALSRVKSRKGLKILILDKEATPTNTTLNVVYKEVFANL